MLTYLPLTVTLEESRYTVKPLEVFPTIADAADAVEDILNRMATPIPPGAVESANLAFNHVFPVEDGYVLAPFLAEYENYLAADKPLTTETLTQVTAAIENGEQCGDGRSTEKLLSDIGPKWDKFKADAWSLRRPLFAKARRIELPEGGDPNEIAFTYVIVNEDDVVLETVKIVAEYHTEIPEKWFMLDLVGKKSTKGCRSVLNGFVHSDDVVQRLEGASRFFRAGAYLSHQYARYYNSNGLEYMVGQLFDWYSTAGPRRAN